MLLEIAGNVVEAIAKYQNTLGHIEINRTIRTLPVMSTIFQRILIEVRTLLPNVVV